jgi:hypothetical protein
VTGSPATSTSTRSPARPKARAWAPPSSTSREGGPVEVIRAGDSVFFEPGENHWHGAAPTRFMAHVAIHQADENGKPVDWGRQVTDDEYAQTPTLGEDGR